MIRAVVVVASLAASAHADVTAPPLVFPASYRNPAADLADVVISNTGSTAITISSLRLTGDAAFVLHTAAPITVQASRTTPIRIAFVPPKDSGAYTADLEVDSDDATTPALHVAIHGSALARTVHLSATSYDVGATHLGETATLAGAIEVSNLDETHTVSIREFAVADPQFAIALPTPRSLAPGESATFDATFAPTVTGDAISNVAIYFDDDTVPDLLMTLTGHADGDRGTYYACSSTNAGAWPIALALLALRRRRR